MKAPKGSATHQNRRGFVRHCLGAGASLAAVPVVSDPTGGPRKAGALAGTGSLLFLLLDPADPAQFAAVWTLVFAGSLLATAVAQQQTSGLLGFAVVLVALYRKARRE